MEESLKPNVFNEIISLVLGVLILVIVARMGYFMGVCRSKTPSVVHLVQTDSISIEFINEALQKGWLQRVK